MSSLDNVDLAALRSCCVRAVHARPGLGAEGDVITCPACGRKIQFTRGQWTANRKR